MELAVQKLREFESYCQKTPMVYELLVDVIEEAMSGSDANAAAHSSSAESAAPSSSSAVDGSQERKEER
jgi:hypothetical protein